MTAERLNSAVVLISTKFFIIIEHFKFSFDTHTFLQMFFFGLSNPGCERVLNTLRRSLSLKCTFSIQNLIKSTFVTPTHKIYTNSDSIV